MNATAATAPSRPCQVIESLGSDEHRSALLEIHEGALDGVIVKHVFPCELLAAAAERISRGATALPIFHAPDGRKGLVYGWPLVASDGAPERYLDLAQVFRTECAALFGAADEPERTIASALASLAGGLDVSVPRAADGRAFLPATIRFLAPGDLLPLHYENEVFGWPGVRELAARLDHSTLMSFYIPMVLAERGGELRLYRTSSVGDGTMRIAELGGDDAARVHFEREGYDVLRPGPGDLLVFDGGRRYHEVTRVEGCQRWTMGGVLAFSNDHRAVHFWS
jgi:hapalindole-type alkaloid chlorinase